MGTYTDLVMSFDLRSDVPDAVLACVADLARGVPQPASAPALPAAVVEDGWWWPEPYLMDDGDPWEHNWAAALSTSMSVGSTGHGQLVWVGGHRGWHLDVRCNHKEFTEGLFELVRWWGPFVESRRPDLTGYRTHLGYLHQDGDPRPHLLWCRDGVMELEDLNVDGGVDARASLGRRPRLEIVVGLPGCGKSTYLSERAAEARRLTVVDDFQRDAVDHQPHPMASRNFGTVLRALVMRNDVILADTRYCIPAERELLVANLEQFAPGLEVVFTMFAPDVSACRTNFLARAAREGRSASGDEASLEQWARAYVPEGALRPVRT